MPAFSASAAQLVGTLSGVSATALLNGDGCHRALFDALPAAVYITDAQGCLTYFNQAAVEFSGRKPQLGTDRWCVTWKLYHPDGKPMPHDQCPMAVALKEGRIIRGAQAIAERPDGVRVWFEPYPAPLRDADGNIIGGINVLVDITARKKTEEALRHSERELSDFFDNAAVGLHWVGPDGVILRANQTELDLLGYGRDEYVGHHISEFHADQDVIEDILRRVRNLETLENCEVRLRCKSGAIKHVLLSSNVYCEGDPPRFVHTRCFTRDITQRRQAQAALRESEERYRTLFDLGPVAVYACDAAGVIRNFNRRAAELWGREPAPGDTDERFCGSFKMFRPDGTFMPHDRCPMADVLSGAIPFVHDGEVHIERPDGSRVVVIVTIRPLTNPQGEITGAINCFYDISERKQAEESLRDAMRRAEAASQAKDQFLAVLSHELRTPLTPVLMSVAAMEFDPDLPPRLRNDLRMIRRNVEMESRLIDDLLDLSRITTGKLHLAFDRLDINDLIRQVCDTCGSNIREKGIRIHCDLGRDIRPVVGDPARLQQVFWNLTNNAAKFTPQGGEIYITSANVDGENGDASVRVTVRDTGKGIAPEILPRIFDAFEQGDAGVTRQFGGMGLGLAISKALVDQHRGTIRALSEGPGKGATFVVELPAMSPEQAAVRTRGKYPVGRDGNPRPLRIMLVEDHPDTAAVLTRLLSDLGHVVKSAASATAALTLAGEHPFDIVVSDVGLPDMTGYELMKQIKEKYDLQGIAISGYGMEEDLRRSEQAGFSDHLVKPLKLAHLDQSIRRVVERAAAGP